MKIQTQMALGPKRARKTRITEDETRREERRIRNLRRKSRNLMMILTPKVRVLLIQEVIMTLTTIGRSPKSRKRIRKRSETVMKKRRKERKRRKIKRKRKGKRTRNRKRKNNPHKC